MLNSQSELVIVIFDKTVNLGKQDQNPPCVFVLYPAKTSLVQLRGRSVGMPWVLLDLSIALKDGLCNALSQIPYK